MRALSLPLLAAFAITCQTTSCPAQTSPPEKAGVPQRLTGPGGADKRDEALSPSTLPKARQAVHEDAASRVDALSPDEARRAARARAHAASRSAPAKAGADTRKTVAVARPPVPPKAKTSASARVVGKASTPGPEVAVDAAQDREQDRVQASRSTHHTRRADARRMIADTDVRPTRLRSATRRTAAGDPERGPRVGDVVPSGVPLYPLPPGFGRRPPPPPYEPHQAYLPGQPPFPGLRGDEVDAAYPPRRIYMAPY